MEIYICVNICVARDVLEITLLMRGNIEIVFFFFQIDPSVATTMHLSWPERFKHVSFDGRLLHAAPASLAPRNPSAPKSYTRCILRSVLLFIFLFRITFLVNVWLQYTPVNAQVFPHEMISELDLSDLALPLSFASQVAPKKAKITQAQHPEEHEFPFGSTGSEHTVKNSRLCVCVCCMSKVFPLHIPMTKIIRCVCFFLVLSQLALR